MNTRDLQFLTDLMNHLGPDQWEHALAKPDAGQQAAIDHAIGSLLADDCTLLLRLLELERAQPAEPEAKRMAAFVRAFMPVSSSTPPDRKL